MTVRQAAEMLRTVRRVVDEEWNKLTPERRRKICDNIMKRAAARKQEGRDMIPEDPLEYKDPRYAEPLHPWEAEEAAQEEEG